MLEKLNLGPPTTTKIIIYVYSIIATSTTVTNHTISFAIAYIALKGNDLKAH